MRRISVWAVALLMLFCMVTGSSAEVPEHYVMMFSKQPFLEVEERFYPEDRIYAVVDFIDLKKGTYNLTVDWITPKGKVAVKDSQVISLQEDEGNWRMFFWLELQSKGAVSQIMGGGEYSSGVYGEWQVVIYCNNEKLTPLSFEITESVL